jgi:hypothetical protein
MSSLLLVRHPMHDETAGQSAGGFRLTRLFLSRRRDSVWHLAKRMKDLQATIACITSRATAASRTRRYAGLVTTPRATNIAVAAAGGWGTFRRIINAPVVASASDTASILDQLRSASVAGPACRSPVTQSAPYPHAIPTALPHSAFRGLADGIVGVKNTRNATAPSVGKMKR